MSNKVTLEVGCTAGIGGRAKPELTEKEVKAIHEIAMGMSHAELETFLQVVPISLLCDEIERRATKYEGFVSAVTGSMDILKREKR
ncbi:MAG: hypothetical protein IKY27_00375 [Bacteroidales bacterium]|nr:hypothetical protein [Bacteroidales bacterium]